MRRNTAKLTKNQAPRLATLGVFDMTTINAKTIINALRAAALAAPIKHDDHTWEAMPEWALHGIGQPWGFCGALEFAECDDGQNYHHVAYEAMHAAQAYGAALLTVAACQVRDLLNVSKKIRIQTSAKGFFTLTNTRAKLEAMAATVKSKAVHFGGGLDKPTRRAAPAVTWPAQALKVAREAIQDHDYAGALDIGADKLGALFYVGRATARDKKTTFAIFGPVACDAPELAGLHSGMREDGTYVVFDIVSGCKTSAGARSRAGAIAESLDQRTRNPNVDLQKAIENARANYQRDQAQALALWKTERNILDNETIEAQAAAQVAALVEAATEAAQVEAQAVALVADAMGDATSEAAPVEVEAVALEMATTCQAEGTQGGAVPSMGASVAHTTTTQAPASAAPNMATLTTEAAQAMRPDAYAGALVALEADNLHNEALLLRAMRGGLGALVQTGRRLVAMRNQAGHQCGQCQVIAQALGRALELAETKAAQATDYTDTRETSGAAASELHDTPRDLDPREPQGDQEKPKGGAFSITLKRGEGPTIECEKPAVTVASFGQANATLHQWSESAPSAGGYDKCDFSITWPDGFVYAGRYDLKHYHCEPASLSQHMIDLAEFETGKNCPAHMSAAAYTNYLNHQDEGTRTAYADVLQRLADAGEYFPRARPVSLDLRAIIEHGGAEVGDLVGMGVEYCGDRANPPQRGAITSAEPCAWQGVRVTVTTEDGATHHASARDFSGEVGARYRLDLKRHGAPYLAQLAAAVATSKANASAAVYNQAQAHAAELARLRTEYAHLQQNAGGKLQGVTLAAANLRKLLKINFPGVKFSVKCEKYSMGNSMSVSWEDGPTVASVEAFSDLFSGGGYNSMEDIYEYSRGAFGELFGTAKYIHTHREQSDALIERALSEYWTQAEGRPTVEDWRKGRGMLDFCHSSSRHHFGKHLAAIDARTPGATKPEDTDPTPPTTPPTGGQPAPQETSNQEQGAQFQNDGLHDTPRDLTPGATMEPMTTTQATPSTPPTDPDALTGAELQTLREGCGLSRDELASMADVQPRTVKHWETRPGGVPADVAALVLSLDIALTQCVKAHTERAILMHAPQGKETPVILTRYREDADVPPAAWGTMTASMQGAAIGRICLALNSRGHHARVIWHDPNYTDPRETLAAQARGHRADQPPTA